MIVRRDRGSRGNILACPWILLASIYVAVGFAASPGPVSVPVDSQRWVGYDGKWSPVTLRVGSPPQWVYVLPNIISQEIWLIGSGGCDLTFTCQEERGGIFNSSQSSTWNALGPYELGFETNLGYQGSADYGYDNVGLSQEMVASEQVIGILNSTQWLTGSLGLGVALTDFTNSNNLTFLSTLVENNSAVLSHSFGYTAGAYYQLKSVPASLTLGGVDTSRFEANDKTFTLDPNQRPVVSINQISVSAKTDTSPINFTSPLSLSNSGDAALFTIDSSTPFLWLPEKVCDRFAEALGLFYNETLQLYTFEGNARNQSDLADLDLVFTFTVADLPGSSNSVELILPYDAFDLELTYPFPNLDANHTSPSMKYFPLRRAANESQYTIGRMFLQETYLAVDYERNTFSLSQARFSLHATTNTNIIEITRPSNSRFPGPQNSSSSTNHSTTTKIGIIVGAVCGTILFIALVILILMLRRRRRRTESNSTTEKPDIHHRHPFFRLIPSSSSSAHRASQAPSSTHDTTDPPVSPAIELPDSRILPVEIPADTSTSRYELEASTPIEMEGSYVPDTYYADRSGPSNLPAELPVAGRRSSTSKIPFELLTRRGQQQQRHDGTDNLPMYTPTTTDGYSNGIPSISPPASATTDSHGRFRGRDSFSPVSPNGTSHGTQGSSSNYGSLPSSLPSRSMSNPNRGPQLQLPTTSSAIRGGEMNRSVSTRSSRFTEQGLGAPGSSIKSDDRTEVLGRDLDLDSGYQLRDEREMRRLERIAGMLGERSTRGEGAEEREPENRRRFSWEEQEPEPEPAAGGG